MSDLLDFLLMAACFLLLLSVLVTPIDAKADTLYCGDRQISGKLEEAVGNGLYKFKTERSTRVIFSYTSCYVEQ